MFPAAGYRCLYCRAVRRGQLLKTQCNAAAYRHARIAARLYADKTSAHIGRNPDKVVAVFAGSDLPVLRKLYERPFFTVSSHSKVINFSS